MQGSSTFNFIIQQLSYRGFSLVFVGPWWNQHAPFVSLHSVTFDKRNSITHPREHLPFPFSFFLLSPFFHLSPHTKKEKILQTSQSIDCFGAAAGETLLAFHALSGAF